MSKSSTAAPDSSTSSPVIKPEDYRHSPVHYAVAVGDHFTLSRLVSTLPRLADTAQIHTESDSLTQERIADRIAAAIDTRDVPFRETPLHLAVRLSDSAAAKTLVGAGADVSLHNSAGWNPLQEALCRRNSEIALILLRHEHRSAWNKWRRRLPRVIAVLRRMRDFYMEISFHFESSVIPFVGKIAPSDTYKIWKRDGDLRADTSLAGFDGLKIQRADQSFLFLGEGDESHDIPAGSLLVLNRDDRKVFNAFENADTLMSDSDLSGLCSQTSVYRPGMDVTKAELVGRTNWRRQEKTESVGEWKAKVYEMHNVVFSFRSRKVVNPENDVAGSEQVLPLELDEDDDGFLVAENPSFGLPPSDGRRHSSFGLPPSDGRRHSSFVREETTRHSTAFVNVGRKSVDLPYASISQRNRGVTAVTTPQTKEKEFVRSLRPSVWLTEQFPLKTEELLPLLDILANKVKAVRRMRELLTTKFPPGTFPVKVAIPVIPTVRVVITFTKFVELPSREQFFTPISSPSLFPSGSGKGNSNDEDNKSESGYFSLPKLSSSSSSSSSTSSWLRRSSSKSVGTSKEQQRSSSFSLAHHPDPFAIPEGYTWKSIDDKSQKMKKSKSVKKSK